ncbi:hypothetical protein BJX63DRAFT_411182 [Aspergillus granulosus]|uniref:Yeast cell wall synthesis Kre9/Knh1-like N-terminal domain-containing protein n=1 Tax=Aspergillus granulosus TaxID=176169 RepID=A0ABR4GX75_9EURO
MFVHFALSLLVQRFVTANEFKVPDGGYKFVAGEPTTITWDPTTPNGTVTLELLWGSIVSSADSDEIDCGSPTYTDTES